MKRAIFAGACAALLLLAASRGHGALAWIVCAPLAFAAATRPASKPRWFDGAIAGSAFALVAALAGEAPWLAEAGRRYFELPGSLALACAVALSATCALVTGPILGIALWRVARLPSAWAVVSGGAAWSAWESLLVIGFPFYPWASLAATQTPHPRALQLASVGGQSGLSFVVAATGIAIGLGLAADRRRRWTMLGVGVAVPLATVALGEMRLRGSEPLSTAPAESSGDHRCLIAAVDAEISSARVDEKETLERYAAATARTADADPTIVVWPESALLRDPSLDADLRNRLRNLAGGGALLVGASRVAWTPTWQEQRFNSLLLVPRDGALWSYDKRVRVPFAEYWPWPLLERPTWVAADPIAAGARADLARAGACAVGLLICFEADRPALAREAASAGANAIAITSNDADLPTRAVEREVAQARLRAVETGLPVLRAANLGRSVAIDRLGRDLAPRVDGVLAIEAGAPQPAPAVAWGGVASWAIGLFALLSAASPWPRS